MLYDKRSDKRFRKLASTDPQRSGKTEAEKGGRAKAEVGSHFQPSSRNRRRP